MTYFETTPFPTLAKNFHTWFKTWRHNLDDAGITVEITDRPDEMPPLIHINLIRDNRQVELYVLFYLGAIEWFFTAPEDITHDFYHLNALSPTSGYETLLTQALDHLAPANAASPTAAAAVPTAPVSATQPHNLTLIGYWHNDTTATTFPKPADHIDWKWDEDDREFITAYLNTGLVARTYMGYAPCRICGRNNGTLERTDGYYVWPDGLAHYVADHGVRLPQTFVDHAYNLTNSLAAANDMRDEQWWQEQGS